MKVLTCNACGCDFTRHYAKTTRIRHCHDCGHEYYKEQVKARSAVWKEIREGRLTHPKRLSCVDCNAPANGYDHRDYRRPLDVAPTCRSCNAKRGGASWTKTPIRFVLEPAPL